MRFNTYTGWHPKDNLTQLAEVLIWMAGSPALQNLDLEDGKAFQDNIDYGVM